MKRKAFIVSLVLAGGALMAWLVPNIAPEIRRYMRMERM